MDDQISYSTPLASQPDQTYHGEWSPHKDVIRKKYLDEGLTQSQLRHFMRVHHGLNKSVSQYERILKTWGFKKYNSRAMYQSVANALKHQQLSIDSTRLVVNGEEIHTKNLRRKLIRHTPPMLSSRWQISPRHNGLIEQAACSGSREGSNDIHVLVRPKQLTGKSMCAVGHIPWTELIESLSKLSVNTHGASHSKNGAVIPASKTSLSCDRIAVILSHETNCIRLPAETLLGLLLSRFANDPDFRTTVIGCQIHSVSRHEFTQSLFRLEAYIPWRFQNDFENSLRVMISSDASESTIVMISYLCYLLSNNHLTQQTISKCITLLSRLEYRNLLNGLLNSTLLSAKSVVGVLLHEACRTWNVDWLKLFLGGHGKVDPNGLLPTTLEAGFRFRPSTPLQIALRHDLTRMSLSSPLHPLQLKTVESLLENSANPNLCGCHVDVDRTNQKCTGNCCTKLPLAMSLTLARSSDIVITLLDSGARVCSCLNVTLALERNLIPEALKRLLNGGASASLNGKAGHRYWFPLQASLGRRDLEVATLLLDYGAHPNEFFAIGDMILENFPAPQESPSKSLLPSLVSNYEMRSPLALSLLFDLTLARRLLWLGANVNDCYFDIMERLPEYSHLAHTVIKLDFEDPFEPWTTIDKQWLDPATILAEQSEPFETCLEAAVSSGCYDMVKLIIQKGALLNGCHNTSALVIAARKGRSDIVQLLIDSGALTDLDRPQISVHMFRDPVVILSPLATASAHGNIQIMAQLIAAGAHVNSCHHEYGLTPLQAAALCGVQASVDLLLGDSRVDIDHPGSRFWKLNLRAAVVQHEISRLFDSCRTPGFKKIQHPTLQNSEKAAPEFPVEDPWLILQELSTFLTSRLTAYLVPASFEATQTTATYIMGSEIRERVNKAFVHALICDELHVAWRILQQGFTISTKTVEVALTLVVCKLQNCGRPEQRRYNDAISSIRCVLASHQWSPIQNSTSSLVGPFFWLWFELRQKQESSDIAPQIESCARSLSLKLCCHEANLMLGNEDLLGFAIERQDFVFASILIYHGFELNFNDAERGTPLELASRWGNEDLVLNLLNHGADINLVDSSSESQWHQPCALGAACEAGHLNIVKLLMSRGALIDGPIGCHYSPLMRAAERNHIAVINELFAGGADVNHWASTRCDAQTALQAACDRGSLDAAIVLINKNADVNAPAGESWGFTALQSAARGGYLRIVQTLVGAGSKISAPAGLEHGFAAVEAAAELGRLDTLKFLLDHYDGDESVSAVCERASALAQNHGQSVITDLLASYARSNKCWPMQDKQADAGDELREHASRVDEGSENSSSSEPEFNIFDFIHEEALQ